MSAMLESKLIEKLWKIVSYKLLDHSNIHK